MCDIEARYRLSAALIREPFKRRDSARDKIYLLAHVTETDNEILLDIRNDTPVYGLNDTPKKFGLDRFGIVNDSVVAKEWRAMDGKPSVIVAGTVLWVTAGPQRRLALLRRDDGAKWAPLHLTFANGRCDKDIEVTAAEEFLEENLVIAGGKACVPEVRSSVLQGEFRAFKKKQIEYKRDILEKKGVNVDAVKTADMVTLPYVEFPEDAHLFKTVRTIVGDKMFGLPFRAIPYFNEMHNTLELMRVAELRVKPGQDFNDVCFIDGEDFPTRDGTGRITRDAKFYRIGELAGDKVTPALVHYLEQRAPG